MRDALGIRPAGQPCAGSRGSRVRKLWGRGVLTRARAHGRLTIKLAKGTSKADCDGLPVCKCTGNHAGNNCARSCGEHGKSNGFTCSCRDGYIGEFCRVILPLGFANTYLFTGCPPQTPHAGPVKCGGECLCGNFTRTTQTCDGAPTYWRHPSLNAPLPAGQMDHGAALFRVRLPSLDNKSMWITSSSMAMKSCNLFYAGGLRSTKTLLPPTRTRMPATEAEVKVFENAGAPDEAEFEPWSACDYANPSNCVDMPHLEVTAIPSMPAHHVYSQ